jgi:mono/diheme cytochrome c family protein
MRPLLTGALIGIGGLLVIGLLGGLVFLKTTGLEARATPGRLETALARTARSFAIPGRERARVNPVLANEESVRNGMAHFADHCASCHGNDGSGTTSMGHGMFPPAPDMRTAVTQDLTDGELFYVIEHGVRFTGMPAWSTGTIEGEESTWHLMNFIRRMPRLTPEELEEMAGMNPKPPSEVRQEIEAERFLAGEDPEPEPPAHAH